MSFSRAARPFWPTAKMQGTARPDVVEVRLFGSLADMQAVPGSDADVLVVLEAHPQERWFDRTPEFAEAFADTDMPVEVFPYTRDELTRLEAGGTGLARAARAGMLLAP